MRLIRMWAVFVDRDGMSVTASPQVRGDALAFVRIAQLKDRLVQLPDGEKLPMTERGDDPALGQLHGRFDLGFIARLIRSAGTTPMP
jgi:hypothetical protein